MTKLGMRVLHVVEKGHERLLRIVILGCCSVKLNRGGSRLAQGSFLKESVRSGILVESDGRSTLNLIRNRTVHRSTQHRRSIQC